MNQNREPGDDQRHWPTNGKAHAPTQPKRRILLSDLMAGGREVTLVYKHAEYRLRITSNDKIILTK